MNTEQDTDLYAWLDKMHLMHGGGLSSNAPQIAKINQFNAARGLPLFNDLFAVSSEAEQRQMRERYEAAQREKARQRLEEFKAARKAQKESEE